MGNYEKVWTEERKKQLLEKYTEIEVIYIEKLERYAGIISDNIANKWDSNYKPEPIDFVDLFKVIDEVETIDLCVNLRSYGQYILGAALPFYSEELKETDFKPETELTQVIGSLDWVSLVARYEKEHVDFSDLDKRLESNITNPLLLEYFNKSKHKWALMVGYYHCWWLINSKGNVDQIGTLRNFKDKLDKSLED